MYPQNPLKMACMLKLGNCNIVFFVCCHHFCIMSQKFPKFERVKNVVKKILKSKSAKLQIWTKLLLTILPNILKLLNYVSFHLNAIKCCSMPSLIEKRLLGPKLNLCLILLTFVNARWTKFKPTLIRTFNKICQ